MPRVVLWQCYGCSRRELRVRFPLIRVQNLRQQQPLFGCPLPIAVREAIVDGLCGLAGRAQLADDRTTPPLGFVFVPYCSVS